MTADWSRDAVSCLIENFRNHILLYDTKHKLYHNKQARRNALEKVKKEVEKVKVGVTAEECQKKYQSLRSHFGAELGRVRQSAGTDDVYRPAVWWYERMLYLKDHIHPRKSLSNLPSEIVELAADEKLEEWQSEVKYTPITVLDDELYAEKVHSPSCRTTNIDDQMPTFGETTSSYAEDIQNFKKKKVGDPVSSAMTTLEEISSFLKSNIKEQKEEQVFASFIASQLNSIKNKKVKLRTKHRIMEAIMKGQMDDESTE